MSDRVLFILGVSYIISAIGMFYFYINPTYNWTPREVAREHIYDYEHFPLKR